jgi:hypothetical protein
MAVLLQALFQLIRPFQWCCTVVSSLNEKMLDILDAPVPYLVGLEKHHIVEFPEDVFVFDLETQEAYTPVEVD